MLSRVSESKKGPTEKKDWLRNTYLLVTCCADSSASGRGIVDSEFKKNQFSLLIENSFKQPIIELKNIFFLQEKARKAAVRGESLSTQR